MTPQPRKASSRNESHQRKRGHCRQPHDVVFHALACRPILTRSEVVPLMVYGSGLATVRFFEVRFRRSSKLHRAPNGEGFRRPCGAWISVAIRDFDEKQNA